MKELTVRHLINFYGLKLRSTIIEHPDPERCAELIDCSDRYEYRSRQCKNKRTDGPYCKRHAK